jgi:hypothetical protein
MKSLYVLPTALFSAVLLRGVSADACTDAANAIDESESMHGFAVLICRD